MDSQKLILIKTIDGKYCTVLFGFRIQSFKTELSAKFRVDHPNNIRAKDFTDQAEMEAMMEMYKRIVSAATEQIYV